MLSLPPDMHRYCFENRLSFKDLQSLERVSKGFKRMVSSILTPLKINLVLQNPCLLNRVPRGDLKDLCWKAIVDQEKILNPYIKEHQFSYRCLGVVENDNHILIAIAGKVYFLISCNMYAHPIPGVNYKIEIQNQEMKITDEIPPGNLFETFKTSLRYNGSNGDGLVVEQHNNSNNWQNEFQYLGKSLFDKHLYLKILPGDDLKKMFLIKINEKGVIQQAYTTVYESNNLFNMAPYSRKFRGHVIRIEYKQIGTESPRYCYVLEDKGLHYWVFLTEKKAAFRVNFEIKAILARQQPYSP